MEMTYTDKKGNEYQIECSFKETNKVLNLLKDLDNVNLLKEKTGTYNTFSVYCTFDAEESLFLSNDSTQESFYTLKENAKNILAEFLK